MSCKDKAKCRLVCKLWHDELERFVYWRWMPYFTHIINPYQSVESLMWIYNKGYKISDVQCIITNGNDIRVFEWCCKNIPFDYDYMFAQLYLSDKLDRLYRMITHIPTTNCISSDTIICVLNIERFDKKRDNVIKFLKQIQSRIPHFIKNVDFLQSETIL